MHRLSERRKNKIISYVKINSAAGMEISYGRTISNPDRPGS